MLSKNLSIELSEKALAGLADIGYDPVFGARPLKRALQKHIQDPLANEILKGNFKGPCAIKVDMDREGNFTFTEK